MKELLKVLEFTADRTQALADSQSVAGEPLHVGDVTLIPAAASPAALQAAGVICPHARAMTPLRQAAAHGWQRRRSPSWPCAGRRCRC